MVHLFFEEIAWNASPFKQNIKKSFFLCLVHIFEEFSQRFDVFWPQDSGVQACRTPLEPETWTDAQMPLGKFWKLDGVIVLFMIHCLPSVSFLFWMLLAVFGQQGAPFDRKGFLLRILLPDDFVLIILFFSHFDYGFAECSAYLSVIIRVFAQPGEMRKNSLEICGWRLFHS